MILLVILYHQFVFKCNGFTCWPKSILMDIKQVRKVRKVYSRFKVECHLERSPWTNGSLGGNAPGSGVQGVVAQFFLFVLYCFIKIHQKYVFLKKITWVLTLLVEPEFMTVLLVAKTVLGQFSDINCIVTVFW